EAAVLEAGPTLRSPVILAPTRVGGVRLSLGDRKASAMGHYKSNVRDLEFNLFESLALDQVLADDAFGDLDGDSVRQMLSEAARLAEGPVAESFAESDRHPPTFDPDTHVVTLPAPFKKSLNAWQEGEWFRVGLGEAVGGVPAPSM